MKRVLIFLILLTWFHLKICAQGEVSVDMYTGTPGIFVSLYSIADHELSENLTMSYNANSTSIYGYGWGLQAGGSVSRIVRGLPDDFADATRTGWLYNTNFSNVVSFPNSSDSNPATYTDELPDYNYIDGLQYLKDTEPDLFSFSVGGISGKFMFNNSGTISLIPYQDILIVPTYSGAAPATKTIIGWTITTSTGIVYSFNNTNTVTRILSKAGAVTTLSLFDRDYKLYSTAVNYSFSWMVSTAQSYTGAKLTYSYTPPDSSTVTKHKNAEIIDPDAFESSIGVIDYYDLLDETTTVVSKTLNKISTSNGPWAVISGNVGINIFDPARSSTKPFKSFTFTYQTNHPDLLASIVESGQCMSMAPYQFYYNSPPIVDGPPVDQFNDLMTPIGVQQDLWGYSNGQTFSSRSQQFPTIYIYPDDSASERYRLYRIPNYVGKEIILNGNSNRTPNGLFPTMNRIIYPAGGETDLSYGPNKYYDVRTGTDAPAGGVRVNYISYYDGVNPLSRITKSFSYLDASGHSSGKLLSRPTFAIPIWEYISPASFEGSVTRTYSTLSGGTYTSNDLWKNLTMVTNFDMSDEGDDQTIVGYTQVTVTRQGSGKAVYNYYVPGAYGDAATGSGSTDWIPTTMKFARPSNMDAGIIKNEAAWIHPSFPNQLYNYEQGLVWNKSEYNNSNVLIRSTQTTYQYVYQNNTAPTRIIGLAYDKFANSSPTMYLYGRYAQLADVAKVVSTETVTTYDENNVGLSTNESTQNQYTSPYHRYVSRVNRTTADGTVYGASFQYVQDYPYTATPSDSTLWMIKLLNDQHRTSNVIEQISTWQAPAGTEKTTGASLVKHRPVSVNGVLTPLVKFQMSYRPDTPGSFSKSYSSGNVFYSFNDPHYQTVNTINEYDNYGLPISSTSESRVTSGTLRGFGQRQPVVTFGQARSISLGFSDFETTTVSSFTVTNKYYGTGRTGINGIHPYATLSRSIVKPSSATTYLLSFWAKPASGNTSITLQVSLNGSSTNYTFNYRPGLSDYQYFTQAIDVTSMPANFTVSISGQAFFAQPSGSSTSLLPLLDDIGFYPDYAVISSVTYDIPFGVNASTDPSGMTSFNAYDSLGRVTLAFDQDHNIRQRYTYAFTGQVVPTLTPIIGGSSSYYVNTSFHFVASSPCITNVTYAWDFNNQNLFSSTGQQSPTLSYSTTGSDTVTLRATHPDYGTKTTTKIFTIVNVPPPPLSVTINSTTSGGLTTFTPTVTGDDGDDGIRYQWATRPSGTTSWTVRSSSFTYTNKILPGTSLDVMCTITTADNHTASSTVTVSN